MTFLLDAQLPPKLAAWLTEVFQVQCVHVETMDLLDPDDLTIFRIARQTKIDVLLTKDVDFIEICERLGPPPRIFLLRCGNASVAALKYYLQERFADALDQLATAARVVEV